jgi:hypothetical protein
MTINTKVLPLLLQEPYGHYAITVTSVLEMVSMILKLMELNGKLSQVSMVMLCKSMLVKTIKLG